MDLLSVMGLYVLGFVIPETMIWTQHRGYFFPIPAQTSIQITLHKTVSVPRRLPTWNTESYSLWLSELDSNKGAELYFSTHAEINVK